MSYPGCRTTPCVVNSVQFKLQNGTPQEPPSGRLKVYAQGGLFYFLDAAGVVHPFGQGTVTSVGAGTSDPNLLITGSPVVGSGTLTFALQGVSAFARTMWDDVDAATVRGTIGVVIGTDVQAWSSDLDAFVVNASWAGANLTLAGDLDVPAGNISAGGDLNVSGSALLVSAVVSNELTIGTRINMGGPTITSGAGVPAGAEPDGSVYLRSGSPNGTLWVRSNSTWVEQLTDDTGWTANSAAASKNGTASGPSNFSGTNQSDFNALSGGSGDAIVDIQNHLAGLTNKVAALQDALRTSKRPNA